jgi:uncharacterized protein Veg
MYYKTCPKRSLLQACAYGRESVVHRAQTKKIELTDNGSRKGNNKRKKTMLKTYNKLQACKYLRQAKEACLKTGSLIDLLVSSITSAALANQHIKILFNIFSRKLQLNKSNSTAAGWYVFHHKQARHHRTTQ